MYGRVDENQTGKGSEEVQLKLYYTNQLPNFGLWLIFGKSITGSFSVQEGDDYILDEDEENVIL